MRTLLGCTVAAFVASSVTPAAAQVYPWCAQYSFQGGATNCYFSTLEQCQAAVSGNGGFCNENLFYTAPARKARPRRQHG